MQLNIRITKLYICPTPITSLNLTIKDFYSLNYKYIGTVDHTGIGFIRDKDEDAGLMNIGFDNIESDPSIYPNKDNIYPMSMKVDEDTIYFGAIVRSYENETLIISVETGVFFEAASSHDN